MTEADNYFLKYFGWNAQFAKAASEFLREDSQLIPARVIGEERDLYRLQISMDASVSAQVSGRIRHAAEGRKDFPAVGDWVLASLPALDNSNGGSVKDRTQIHHILPRKSLLRRKVVDRGVDSQNIASNIDFLFIATSMNDDLNIRRLERYLTLGWDSGAQPILILTKADLHPDAEALLKSLREALPATLIYPLTMKDPYSFQFFDQYFQPGHTAVVIGSSGVGKSTLINQLVGSEVAKTQAIRESDAKGKHTTSARFLFRTATGGLIIDTPGMRELQLQDHEEGLQKQFEDIEELTLQCKFSDCKHQKEPGCRILSAIADGTLEPDRWRSYLKLSSEVKLQQQKLGKALVTDEKKKWKKVSAAARDKSLRKRDDSF